jgi:hydroxymethylpyrimidine/phosphomethylpyrimidine kinase
MTTTSGRPPRILSIAGSDSSGGAGIQADIKTATALGAYAMTAITAVTVQDTLGVRASQLMPSALVRAQIRACLDDIGADAIKIGMLGSSEIVRAVDSALRDHDTLAPIVLDPVLASTSGTKFLDERGIRLLRETLIPLATLVTPNLPEAELLTGIACSDEAGIRRAGETLLARGAKAILIKGGHGAGTRLIDTLITPAGHETFAFPRIDTAHTHGTGCTYATAIAVGLAEGRPLSEAITRAVHFVHEAIEAAPGFGHGHGPLNHMHGRG